MPHAVYLLCYLPIRFFFIFYPTMVLSAHLTITHDYPWLGEGWTWRTSWSGAFAISVSIAFSFVFSDFIVEVDFINSVTLKLITD